MKTYSIKTVDGSRFDYVDVDNVIGNVEKMLNSCHNNTGNYFLGFPVENGTKYFNIRHVVSITEVEVDK